MAKLLRLRFLDVTDKENPTFITLFAEGQHKGYFKKDSKGLIDSSAEGTTCRSQKKLLMEVRSVGYPWKQVDRSKFKSLLRGINVMRINNDWDTIELPELESNSGN